MSLLLRLHCRSFSGFVPAIRTVACQRKGWSSSQCQKSLNSSSSDLISTLVLKQFASERNRGDALKATKTAIKRRYDETLIWKYKENSCKKQEYPGTKASNSAVCDIEGSGRANLLVEDDRKGLGNSLSYISSPARL